MALIKLTIDNIEIKIEQGKTVLQAAQAAGIYIPALCAHPDLPPAPGLKADKVIYLSGQPYKNSGADTELKGCRLCLVEVEGTSELLTSCNLTAKEGMVVHTNTSKLQEQRRENLKHILAKHPHSCMTCRQREGCSPFESCPNSLPPLERCCAKLGYCELQSMAEYIGLTKDIPPYKYRGLPVKKDEPLFTQDYNLCIGCTRCVRICRDVRGVGALGFINMNGEVFTGPIAPTLKESGCKFCGACVEVCPTGALQDTDIKRAEREQSLVPCSNTCPAGINAPRYIHLIVEGMFKDALGVIRERVPLPAVLGRVCTHPCEKVCRRGQLNNPIAICALKRFAADQITDPPQITIKPASTGKKVAIVGSGPSGLTTAYYLAKLGHSVTVFESLSEPGGMMRFGIPSYRLPKDVLDKEIAYIKNTGIEIRTNNKIESLNTLWKEGFNAIYLAMGTQKSRKLGIEGEDIAGVNYGIEFLRQANSSNNPPTVNRSVIVIGGGNVAVDVARTALRLGAQKVDMVSLEQRHEMPALPEEIEATLEEGITIHNGWGPCRILGNKHLESIELKRCTHVFDKEGRFCPAYNENDLNTLKAEQIIIAIGQTAEIPNDFEIQVIGDSKVKVDSESLSTNIKGVFAGGDVVSGPTSVIQAIATGRKAAKSIDKYLGGTGNIDESLTKELKINPYFGHEDGFADRNRASIPCLPLDRRNGSFSEVELGFDKQTAVSEAKRCLRCDVRLSISRVIMPPDKWIAYNEANVEAAPQKDGVFRLFDENKEIIYIGSGSNVREALLELNPNDDWVKKIRYLHYEETLMYTMRESELIQQFLQEHGRMPEGNEDLF